MLKHLLPLVVIIVSLLVSSSEVEPVKLFNGKDLSGWHPDVPAADGKPDAPPSFIVRDGLLVSLGKPEGHLITDQEYENYRLTVEYRFPKEAGNCGVLVHASKPRALYDMFPQSIEVQMHSGNAGDFWCIQENIEVPAMEKRRPRKQGQSFGGGPSDARNIKNLTDDSEKPLGEWNTMVIECRGDEIKVWVNDDLVNHGTKCTATKGKIAVQAEGTEVEFRKLELERLPDAQDIELLELLARETFDDYPRDRQVFLTITAFPKGKAEWRPADPPKELLDRMGDLNTRIRPASEATVRAGYVVDLQNPEKGGWMHWIAIEEWISATKVRVNQGTWSGPLGGGGMTVTYEKIEGRWQPIEISDSWVS